jgi:ABC-type dipeptide/oligopeptide/nickel transport system permease component
MRNSLEIVLRRIGRAVIVMFGVVTISFTLVRMIPGDTATVLLGEMANPTAIEEMRRILGTDGPLHEQFLSYLTSAMRGDLGISIRERVAVRDIIAARLPVTLLLATMTVALSTMIAVPLGVIGGLHPSGRIGAAFRLGTTIMLAAPVFFTALILMLVLAVHLAVLPIGGFAGPFPQNLRYLVMPSIALSLILAPLIARILSSTIEETRREEFVEAAIIRGVSGWPLLWSHLLRPSLAPVIALMGFLTASLVAGTVLTDVIFSLPGIGSLLLQAVGNRDYTMVQGIVLVTGAFVVLINLVADLLAAKVDPRARVI